MINLFLKRSFKESAKFIILSILLLAGIRFFRTFPFSEEFFKVQALILVMLFGFFIFYVLRKLILNEYITTYELFLIFMAFFFPLYSSFRANIVFGQPFILGILSERGWLTILTGVLFLYKLSRNKWTLDNLVRTLIILSWLSLILYFALYLLADPYSFDRSFVSFPKLKGVHFKLNSFFIAFGLIYYSVMSIRQKKTRYMIFFLLFLCYIVFFDRGRGLTISIGLTLAFLVYSQSQFRMRNFVIAALVICFVFFVLISISPGFYTSVSNSIQQVVETINDSGHDLSNTLKTRVLELGILWEYVKQNPGVALFGCGKLSLHWNGGFSGKFDYFYPSDLGIAGAWFVYGILGLILVFLQFFFVFRGGRQSNVKSDLYITLKLFIIFLLINSFLTGVVVLNPFTLVIPAIIIFHIRNNGDSESDA